MANKQNLKPFKGGYDKRRNLQGRPRKYISELKQQGYTLGEVTDCIQVMLSMTIDELKAVFTNDEATVLEKTIANAMVVSLKKGSLYSLETLLSRIYGTPKQTQDVTMATTINIVAPDKDTTSEIQKL